MKRYIKSSTKKNDLDIYIDDYAIETSQGSIESSKNVISNVPFSADILIYNENTWYFLYKSSGSQVSNGNHISDYADGFCTVSFVEDEEIEEVPVEYFDSDTIYIENIIEDAINGYVSKFKIPETSSIIRIHGTLSIPMGIDSLDFDGEYEQVVLKYLGNAEVESVSYEVLYVIENIDQYTKQQLINRFNRPNWFELI